jgi:hypothetical protein
MTSFKKLTLGQMPIKRIVLHVSCKQRRIKARNSHGQSSKKLEILACAGVRVRMFSNFRVRVRARAHVFKFSRARACACACFQIFACAGVRVRISKKFSRARACAGASLKIFAGACAHVRARALTGAFFLNFLGNKYI